MTPALRTKVIITLLAAALLAAVAVGFGTWSARRADGLPAPAAAGPEPVRLDNGPSLLLIRNRHLATVLLPGQGLPNPSSPLRISPVECVRAYAAGGTAVCLHQDTPWAYSLHTFDAALHETRAFAIEGLPNRAQVSASGRMVAWTSFTGGDSYNGGQFSTRTGILDTRTGERTDSLESFSVLRAGRPYHNVDANFWGVTFTGDDNRFYATMATAGRRYLVAGDYAARQVRTVAENVECPSVSPDGTRLAFKQAIGGDPDKGWRLSVLDLASLRVTPLAETRSIDEQAAWISADLVAYTVRDSSGEPSIWSARADGTGPATLILASAESPAALSRSLQP